MDRWQVDELLILADALATADLNTFVVRWALQRLERGEITPLEAARNIRRVNHGATERLRLNSNASRLHVFPISR